MASVSPGYLIPHLRLTIGDTNPSSYRYTNEWLLVSLESSIIALARWWSYKYQLDSNRDIIRNSDTTMFWEEEPPVIQLRDERPIILMAAYILLEGSLENSAYDLASWRDNEISYTNLEMGRVKDSNLKRIWEELQSILVSPSKRLAGTIKGSLPGYLNNPFERDSKY